MTSRASKRAQLRTSQNGEAPLAKPKRPQKAANSRPSPWRLGAFLILALVVLGGGTYLATSVFFGQRNKTTVTGALALGISMNGFDPVTLDAQPGQTLTLDWWNQDSPDMLTNGVHTLISDSMSVHLEVPGQSRKTVLLTAPQKPGDYDFWCDSCCGGKANPKMHGTLHVEAGLNPTGVNETFSADPNFSPMPSMAN